jgi:hypothetical protein
MLFDKFLSPAPLKERPADFLQISGENGAGSRRMAFSFLRPKSQVLWVASPWQIYAPALWSLAKEKEIFLTGLDKPQKLSYKRLFYELYESQAFETWILDHLRLKNSDGFFLMRLLKNSRIQIIVLEDFPYSFCQKRLRVVLSHHHYRLQWTKGGPLQPQYIAATHLTESLEDICMLQP